LLSCQKYYWRVRWWNSAGEVSPYSDIFSLSTGFMGGTKFKASWITKPQPESFSGQQTTLSWPGRAA